MQSRDACHGAQPVPLGPAWGGVLPHPEHSVPPSAPLHGLFLEGCCRVVVTVGLSHRTSITSPAVPTTPAPCPQCQPQLLLLQVQTVVPS